MVFINLVHGQMGFVEHVVVKIETIDHTIARIVRPTIVKEIVWVVGHVVVSVVAPIDDIFVNMVGFAFVIDIVLFFGYVVERIAHVDHIVVNSIITGIFCKCE